MRDFTGVSSEKSKSVTGLGGVLLIIFALLLAVVMAVIGLGWWWYQAALQPLSGSDEPKMVVIPRGSSTVRIAEILKSEGLIRNAWAFRIFARRARMDGTFQAGSYQLSKKMSVEEIAKRLQVNADGVWVTIVEGWRREETGLALDKTFGQGNENWSLNEFLRLTDGKEGYLFPETYLLPRLMTTEAVVNLLFTTFEEKTKELREGELPLELNFDEVTILASLLEREAAADVDLPIVAGIFINRIEQGWFLNVDATLQYIKVDNSQCVSQPRSCENWWPVPLAIDKEIDVKMNTYLYTGVPPSAIASPGLKALTAMSRPASVPYMFYLTDNSGAMHYALTYDEHLDNIEKYLR